MPTNRLQVVEHHPPRGFDLDIPSKGHTVTVARLAVIDPQLVEFAVATLLACSHSTVMNDLMLESWSTGLACSSSMGWRHDGRVVKAMDSKSIGVSPRRFKSCS